MSLIQLDNVGLRFQVRRFGRISLKEYLLQGLFPPLEGNHLRGPSPGKHRPHREPRATGWGSSATTGRARARLLKLLAGIYPPTSGRRQVHGRISALFDIALGFEQDASGWENIMYRGYLQGETPRSIRAKMQPIAEFSELGDFLNMPVRYYSAGMMVRLAFSIATAIEPEILIVDEVLSAGDMAFQSKARERMRTLMSTARAVIVVSHDLTSLELLCDRVLWLDHGRARLIGPTKEVIAAYKQQVEEGSQ